MENNNRQGCRWVDGTEFPEYRGYYFVETKTGRKDVYYWHNEENSGSAWENDVSKWLSESIEPCATSSENELGKGNFLSTMEAEYWRKRCEAAEEVFQCLPDYLKFDTRKDEAMYDDAHKAWQQLKSQTPSPTGDRDCEELKKEVERLKGLCHELWNEQYPDENLKYVQEEWQQFKTENNL